MLDVVGRSIAKTVAEAVSRHGANPLLILPSDPGRPYHPNGVHISYAEVAAIIST